MAIGTLRLRGRRGEKAGRRGLSSVPVMVPRKRSVLSQWCTDNSGVARTVGLHDSLFDLGGHSLLITRIISRIRKVFHVDVAIHAFFESPTLQEIAAIIERNAEQHSNDDLSIPRLSR